MAADRTASTEQAAGVARVDDRRVLNGMFYVLWTGSP
jgi:transposase